MHEISKKKPPRNEKDLHIDNFPTDLKYKARERALSEHKTFKQWVIDVFTAAIEEKAS
jgi:hypothetical protein